MNQKDHNNLHYSSVKRQNICFGLSLLFVFATVAGLMYFSSGDLALLADEVSTETNVVDPYEGWIGNDVTNEEEEQIIDKEMEKLEDAHDHVSKGYPSWAKAHEEYRRNWTDWFMERSRLNITGSHNSSTGPSFDEDGFLNFLNNRFNSSDRTKFLTKRPYDKSEHSSAISGTTLKQVSLKDGIQYDVLGTVWHNKDYFTQGLSLSKEGLLYESVGLYGQSKVCRLNPDDGTALKCLSIPRQFFAEGLSVFGKEGEERLIQISWKERTGWVRDVSTLEVISEFTFSSTANEGWGITWDEINNEFIVSDGSEFLHFWDADTLNFKRKVKVSRQSGSPAYSINELEFINGYVLANIWYEDVILVIDPLEGSCIQEYDFSSLWPEAKNQKSKGNVLNGISLSPERGVIYVTGKRWESIYKVKLRHFQ